MGRPQAARRARHPRPAVPERVRRHRHRDPDAADGGRGDRQGLRLLGPDPDDPGARHAADPALRLRRAEGALPAEVRQRRVVAGLRALRARGRQRPGGDADDRRPRRRRVGDQRPEELDHQRRRSPTSTSSSPSPTARTSGSAPSSSRRSARASTPASSSTSSGSRARRPARPSFTDVRVPHENLVGAEGKGLSVALGTLERTRLGAAAQAVGIAQGATDYANEYAKERIAFGKPINDLQGIQFKLADMETGTAAARELLYKACSMADLAERPAEPRASGPRWRSCSPPTTRWR